MTLWKRFAQLLQSRQSFVAAALFVLGVRFPVVGSFFSLSSALYQFSEQLDGLSPLPIFEGLSAFFVKLVGTLPLLFLEFLLAFSRFLDFCFLLFPPFLLALSLLLDFRFLLFLAFACFFLLLLLR